MLKDALLDYAAVVKWTKRINVSAVNCFVLFLTLHNTGK